MFQVWIVFLQENCVHTHRILILTMTIAGTNALSHPQNKTRPMRHKSTGAWRNVKTYYLLSSVYLNLHSVARDLSDKTGTWNTHLNLKRVHVVGERQKLGLFATYLFWQIKLSESVESSERTPPPTLQSQTLQCKEKAKEYGAVSFHYVLFKLS